MLNKISDSAEWSLPEENVNCMFFVDDIIFYLNHVNIGKCTLKDRLLSIQMTYI